MSYISFYLLPIPYLFRRWLRKASYIVYIFTSLIIF